MLPAIIITTIPAPINSLSITSTLEAFKRVSKALIVATYPVVSIIPIDKFKFSIKKNFIN